MTYEQAQRYLVEAEEALRNQNWAMARSFFRKAAHIQEEYVKQLPRERQRSRSAFGLSAVSLYYRSDDLDSASRLAHTLLGSGPLELCYEERLEEILRRIRNQQVLMAHQVGKGYTSLNVHHQMVEGTVRAIDLDKKRLRIEQENGVQVALSLPPRFSTEILEYLLNRQVIITQIQPPRRKRLTIADIELKQPRMEVG